MSFDRLTSPAVTVRLFIATILGLTVLHFIAGLTGIAVHDSYTHWSWAFVRLFDMDREMNIPTWFSAVLLLLCALRSFEISRRTRQRNSSGAAHWAGLALLFGALSLDEVAEIHEIFSEPMRILFNAAGYLYFAWVIPAFGLVVLIALLYRRFVLELPGQTRKLFLIAGLLYLVGSMGVELLGGQHWSHNGRYNLTYLTLTAAEEILEMVGVVVFFHALRTYGVFQSSGSADDRALSGRTEAKT